MNISYEKLEWLTYILDNYLGEGYSVHFKENKLFISFREVEIVEFKKLNPLFYEFGKSNLSCSNWNPLDEGFLNPLEGNVVAPGLDCDEIFDFKNGIVYCNYDILGLVFWCLNRLEEIGNPNRDSHDRYPFKESHAYQYRYVEYPIVDQWIDILKQAIHKVKPSINFKVNTYQPILTHDIDRPARYYFSTFRGFLKTSLADLIRVRSVKSFISSFDRFLSPNKIPKSDPYNSFDWIMDLSEKYGLISRFYFICGGDTKFDANYSINDEIMRSVTQSIQERGHEIGLHPSYSCYLDEKRISEELSNLRQSIGLPSSVGSRMHYLRFLYPETLHNLSSAGITYDSSLGYAEHIGFRCGTSQAYKPFDPKEDKIINIKVYPLIVMDGTLTSYMGLNLNNFETLVRVKSVLNASKIYGGNFVILWHNSELKTHVQRDFYENLVSSL